MAKSAILCLISIGGAAFAANSVEPYLKAPFAYELSAAPSGGKIAWILDEHGARNIWVAAAPDYKGRRLTPYKEDDGQDVGEIAWSADGRTVLFTRGGDLDTNGDNPNPRNLASPPQQSVFAISFDGGAVRKLGDGRSPAVSRDGRVAFLKNGQIWMTALDGAKPAAIAIDTKASSSDLVWSPDGTGLAFTSSRGDHGFIGILRAGDRSVTYLDPSLDRDSSPSWSADSRRVAFLRRAYSSAIPVGPVREVPTPWSIRIADVASARGREVWRADKGPGSAFRSMEADTQILWADGDHLVFPWERDGWLHLYSVPAAGGRAQLLTPGDFEIEHASLSRNRRDVLFSSNQDDIDRRHLWRVAASGGRPAPLLGLPLGEGIEFEPVEPADGVVAFLRSSVSETSRASIKSGNAKPRDLATDSIPADSAAAKDFVKPQQVIFPASDGLTIHGQLFLPRGDGASRHAAVIFFHGGSRRQMLLGYHYRRYYSNAYSMNQYLAGLGFVVLSVNYRSGTGYGLNFREAPNFGNSGGSEFSDVLGAGAYMAARADVDPARIGAWGGSYGGYLTALALARASNMFAAGVDMHGVEDWSIRGDRTLTPLNIDELRAVEKTALQSSPLADVKDWRSPVLLIHGDDDRNVAFHQSVMLVEALRARGVEFEELIFPGEVHEFLLDESWTRAYNAAADFLTRKLQR
ncbi:MAG TPA: prolyl oligopeptidase family serine peptidase [Bryobacteraceae bacterium]